MGSGSGIAAASAPQLRPRLPPSQSLAALKQSDSQSLVLPFLALFLFPPPNTTTLTLACLHTLTPPPSFRDPNVLGSGISWSLLIIIGCFLPSPTHTLSLHPSWSGPWKRNRKVLVSSRAPFPLPPLPPPRTGHLCPLCSEQGGEYWVEPSLSIDCLVMLGVSSNSLLFSPFPQTPTTCHHHDKPCDRVPTGQPPLPGQLCSDQSWLLLPSTGGKGSERGADPWVLSYPRAVFPCWSDLISGLLENNTQQTNKTQFFWSV